MAGYDLGEHAIADDLQLETGRRARRHLLTLFPRWVSHTFV
jgi:hypothetical protein